MWWCKSRANPHQPRQPCHDSMCPHNGTRSSNFQRHAPFAGRCRGVRRKHLPGVNGFPPPRAENHGPLRTRRRTNSRPGAQPCSGGQIRGIFGGGRSRHQTRHRGGPGIRIGHEQWPIPINGPKKWAIDRKMALNNGLFLDGNGLAWPVWRKPLGGFGRRAGSRSLNQAEQWPVVFRACPLHPDATVVAIDYRPAVVGAVPRQRQPRTRFPWWA